MPKVLLLLLLLLLLLFIHLYMKLCIYIWIYNDFISLYTCKIYTILLFCFF